jgi:hypothetical protein
MTMKGGLMKGFLFVLLAGLVVFAYADAPIYGYFWTRFTYENPTQPEDVETNANYFSIERGYIRWKTKTSPVSFKGTIDVSQKSDATNKSDWNIRLKYAQADWTLPYVADAIPDAKLMIGLQKVYFGIVDLWGYQLIDKNLEENEKKMNSADLGIGFYGLLPAGYGEFSVQAFNGNGYTSVTETNTNKALCANLAVIPYPGIMFKGSYWMAETPFQQDSVTIIQVDQNRYAGLVQLTYGPAKLIGEYLGTKDHETDGMGYSGILEFDITKTVSILGRYDYFDPDTDVDDNGHNLILGGINWHISDVLLAQCNYHLKTYEDDDTDSSDNIMVQFKYSY